MGAVQTSSAAEAAPRRARKVAPYLVDCDCHHVWHDIKDLFPYLPRQYVEDITNFGSMLAVNWYTNMPNRLQYRLDHEVDEHTDFAAFTVQEHLDAHQFDAALLTGQNLYAVAGSPRVDYAAALCRAFNDWTLEHWVAKDPRYRMALAVGPNDPGQAVEEIERLGDHPCVVAVMLPAGARMPYGNQFYHPIYAAAERHRLAMVTHFGAEGHGVNSPPTAAGFPTHYLEMRMARPQIAQAHTASLVCEGVFEKYPGLKWLFIEVDMWWLPGLMWHFDADWKALRDYTPWVKRLPSEYIRDHIRVGTQPMEQPPARQDLAKLFEWAHADEVLVYASDFPHWDWDEPRTVAADIPRPLRNQIFGENARALLNL